METIGDAYMIVSGIPEQTSIHAQPVANFAMDMVEDAGMVHSPATGLPLQVWNDKQHIPPPYYFSLVVMSKLN